MRKKEAIVIHSGGMDSSICLALAKKEFGAEAVLSLSFSYNQRHSNELVQAAKISADWGIDHVELSIACLQEITESALFKGGKKIEHANEKAANTLVTGRNGLMARLGAIHADHLGANCIYMGVIEVEAKKSGYRDCSREYIDLMQQILRMDLANPSFEIRTPLVFMTKAETMVVADSLGLVDYLLKETISCYEGIMGQGCGKCPACVLRNEGIQQWSKAAKAASEL